MCLFLCGTLFLISAYFSSLKSICKKHFDITCFLLLFRNKNKPVFVMQNRQCGTFIKIKENKSNNGIITFTDAANCNILPQVVV